jgi:ferredoxin
VGLKTLKVTSTWIESVDVRVFVLGEPSGAPVPDSAPGSNMTAAFEQRFRSLLELAEACDVQVSWSCRTRVCHNCESGLVAGNVAYDPDPIDPPPTGSALICCSRQRATSSSISKPDQPEEAPNCWQSPGRGLRLTGLARK